MGNLLRLLSRDEDQNYDDLFVDFENAEPSESEVEVYDEVSELLVEAGLILQSVRGYCGAGAEIRMAISEPRNEEYQRQALDALIPLISKLQSFFLFSQRLVQVVPLVLQVLCSTSMTPFDHLSSQQALVKSFAELLDFVLSFDEVKLCNPSIQNDLSYYRRTRSRSRVSDHWSEEQRERLPDSPCGRESFELSDEVANLMSLFYAHSSPMLNVLSEITSKFLVNNKDIDYLNVTEILSTVAKVCMKMIENRSFYERFQKKEETMFFILRVMVGVIILYDHVHPSGVFVKSSLIDVKSAIRILKDQPTSESLMNALRFTTKHLNDATTPKQIRAMLA